MKLNLTLDVMFTRDPVENREPQSAEAKYQQETQDLELKWGDSFPVHVVECQGSRNCFLILMPWEGNGWQSLLYMWLGVLRKLFLYSWNWLTFSFEPFLLKREAQMTLITKRENLLMLMLTEQHCSEGRDVISCYLFMLLSTEEPGGDTGKLGTVLE